MRWFLALPMIALGWPAWGGELPQWHMVPEESTLTFTASYDEEPFDGRFERFEVCVGFDPAALDSATLRVTVDVTSVDTRNSDRDEALADPEWFDFENHPDATYEGQGVTGGERRAYRMEGELSLKGNTHTVPIEFDWETLDADQARLSGRARMRGDTMLNRLRFDIGTGEWEDPLIGHEVEVRFDVLLRRAVGEE